MSNQNLTFLYIIGFIIFFYLFIMPYFDSKNNKYINNITLPPTITTAQLTTDSNVNNPEQNNNKLISREPMTIEKLDNIFDNDITKIDMNKCSKSCCKHAQWNIPFITQNPDYNNFIGSNFSCNFGDGSGCLCVTKNDMNVLTNRGFSK